MTEVEKAQAKRLFTDLILLMYFTFIHRTQNSDSILIVTCVKFYSQIW